MNLPREAERLRIFLSESDRCKGRLFFETIEDGFKFFAATRPTRIFLSGLLTLGSLTHQLYGNIRQGQEILHPAVLHGLLGNAVDYAT